MKARLLFGILLTLIVAGCATSPPGSQTKREADQSAVPQLNQETFLYEVVRYVYLWHFDESYFLVPPSRKTLDIWTRRLEVELDPGDRSQFAEIWIPAVKLRLELKRSDYAVPQMGLVAKDDTFKIVNVERLPHPPARRSRYTIVNLDRETMRDYLLRTRNERLFPGPALQANVRQAVLKSIRENQIRSAIEPQLWYVAPISPVSNVLWVFWENQRKLLMFSADMDLSNPNFWELTPLTLDMFNLDVDVVVSHQEVPGSNAYVTKDWVGRILFNCIVLGKKHVTPAEDVNRLQAETGDPP